MFRKQALGLASAFAVLFAIGASSLPAQAQQQAESRLQKVQKSGVLRVGTTGDFNPMSFRDPADNQYKGFDIDAMTQLAKDLGVKVEWVQTDWATLITGVVSNRYDIFAGGSSINVARAKVAAFTVPYFEAGTVPLVLRENAAKFKNWEAINQSGVKVAVTLGTVFADHAKQHFPKATITTIQSPANGYQEVLAKRADVTITSNVEASSLIQRYKEMTLVADATPRNRRPFGYVVAQDDAAWVNFLNTWVTLKKLEGFFEGLEAKWMPKN